MEVAALEQELATKDAHGEQVRKLQYEPSLNKIVASRIESQTSQRECERSRKVASWFVVCFALRTKQ